MKIADLADKLPKELYESLLASGLEELRPPQELAIKAGLLERQNIVVSSPTSSGKSLVAELAVVKNILEGRGKAVYIVPLRALASEKYKDFSEKYPYVKTALSIGDYDSSDPWLENYDLIITTSEKMDSLIRHGASWLGKISTVVVDEVHLLDDVSRGPTLEILITRLKHFLDAQFIALSATISNAKEIADWLGAILVRSDYRPVRLEEGVYYDGVVDFGSHSETIVAPTNVAEVDLIVDTVRKGKSALVFLSSRKNAEAVAKKAKSYVGRYLTDEEKEELSKLSSEVLNVLDIPTKQCKLLSECVSHGIAFHHAGLLSKQRELIEDAFRKRLIKIICCTPTMAMGLNVPAFRVIVRDLKRYSGGYSDWIPVLEYKQWVGRAGRPGLEEFGEGISIAKSKEEKEIIIDRYINGIPEDIFSKLSAEPVLRMQILGLVASGEISSFNALSEFFSKTFFAFQYKDLSAIEAKLGKIIDELIDFGFLKREVNVLRPTLIGKRVAELYIDPYSANFILERLENSKKNPIFYLHTISSCIEMPRLSIKQRELPELQEKFFEYEEMLPEAPNPWDYDYEVWLRAFKTSLLFLDWINEKSEDEILDKYGEAPGLFRNKLYYADWLLYSMEELAKLKKLKEDYSEIKKLRLRVKYGIREELAKLVQIKGIGRVKARRLFNAGIKTPTDLKKTPLEELAKLIGKKTAEKILSSF